MRPVGSRSVEELESRITDLSNENLQLRAQLADAVAALKLVAHLDGPNACGVTARRALADIPDAPTKGEP